MLFFFNDTATTEIYTLSLHDALPISLPSSLRKWSVTCSSACLRLRSSVPSETSTLSYDLACSRKRSEEHTSELQSRQYLVCRLLLEKKKKPGQPDVDRSAGAINSHAP